MAVVTRTYTSNGLYKRQDGSYASVAFNANVIVANIIIKTENRSLKSVEAIGFYSQWEGTGATYGGRNITIRIKDIDGNVIASISSGETGNLILTRSTTVPLPCLISVDLSATTNTAGGAGAVTVNHPNEWKLNNCNTDVDFVFVTTVVRNILLLPDVNEYPAGKLLFIKDLYSDANVYDITVVASNNSIIADTANNAYFVMNQPSACLTLFNNGIHWSVANYYPSYLQANLPASTTTVDPGYKRANATANCINIFSTNTAASIGELRKSGSNAVDLPALDGTTTPPQMCIVVYSGDTTASRNGSNALIFYSNYEIDGGVGSSPPYTSTSRPYIVCNDNTKNTGVVFISDGLTWYIAGWFNGSNWAPSPSITAPNSGVNVSLGTINSNTMDVLSTNGGGNYYVLPQNSITDPYVFAVKAQRGATAMVFETMPFAGSSGTIVINNNIKSMYFNQAQTNVCVWFVRAMSGSTMIYYPIISYTPGS